MHKPIKCTRRKTQHSRVHCWCTQACGQPQRGLAFPAQLWFSPKDPPWLVLPWKTALLPPLVSTKSSLPIPALFPLGHDSIHLAICNLPFNICFTSWGWLLEPHSQLPLTQKPQLSEHPDAHSHQMTQPQAAPSPGFHTQRAGSQARPIYYFLYESLP